MQITDGKISIPVPALFSFQECLHFLDRGYDDCLYSIGDGYVIKPLEIGGKKQLIRIKEGTNSLEVEMLNEKPEPLILQLVGRWVEDWFDLNRDLTLFYKLLDEHAQLSFMVENFRGLRLMGIPNLFEALCWCVIGQQINLTFAHRLKRRLVETYGTAISYQGQPYYYFPKPEVLAELDVEQLKTLQFSRQKAEYTIGIATAFARGELSKDKVKSQPSSEQMLQKLQRIRGVGKWTANYVLMKSLARMDCIPYGDSGLNTAVASFLKLDRKPTQQEVNNFFAPFNGWESYLVIYLWRTLS